MGIAACERVERQSLDKKYNKMLDSSKNPHLRRNLIRLKTKAVLVDQQKRL